MAESAPLPPPINSTEEYMARMCDLLGQVLDRLPQPAPSGPDDQGRTLVQEPKAAPRPTSPRPGRKRT